MKVNLPPIKPIDLNSPEYIRRAAYEKYRDYLVLLNPHIFNSNGSKKSFFERLKWWFK